MLNRLRQAPLAVAPGTVSAATDHLESVAKRLALVNRQIGEAEEQLDRLTARLADEGDAEGQPR